MKDPHCFQIYQNVPLWDLSPSGQDCSAAYPDLAEFRFRYVFCREGAVHLAVAADSVSGSQQFQRLDDTSFPGLLIVGDTRILRHASVIRDKLVELEDACSYLSKPVWRYQPYHLPRRDIDSFCRKMLLEEWRCLELARDRKPYYRLTDYGWAMGVSMGYTMDESGRIRCTPICSKERIAALKAPWSGTCTGTGARIPLELRLQRLNEGLPGDPSHNARVACQMAGITLRDYTADLPQDLDNLLENLSTDDRKVDGDVILRDAAEIIHRFLDGPPDMRTKGLNALWYLARSIEYGYRKRRVR